MVSQRGVVRRKVQPPRAVSDRMAPSCAGTQSGVCHFDVLPQRAQAVWKLLRHEEPAAWKVHVDGSGPIESWEPATGAEIALMRAA